MWRARYGAEFAELLIADLAERPRSARRTVDVAAAGLRARLACAGLSRHGLGPVPDPGTGLATASVSAAGFAILGLAEASQLGIGVQWLKALALSPEHRSWLSLAMALMSAALAGFALLALAAAMPLGLAVARAWRAGQAGTLRGPLLVIGTAVTTLLVGGRHFGNGWPGTGSQYWFGHGTAGVAAFGWAATSWFTSWWVHPGLLATMPTTRICWQVVSLTAWIALLTGAWRIVRELASGHRASAYGRRLFRLAGWCAAGFGVGTLLWLAAAPAGPAGPIHFGLVNLGGLGASLVALVVALAALRQVGGPACHVQLTRRPR